MSACGNCGGNTHASDICERCEAKARGAEAVSAADFTQRARAWLTARYDEPRGIAWPEESTIASLAALLAEVAREAREPLEDERDEWMRRAENAAFPQSPTTEVEKRLIRDRDALGSQVAAQRAALETLWASIGDALCSGKGISLEYGQAVSSEITDVLRDSAATAAAHDQRTRLAALEEAAGGKYIWDLVAEAAADHDHACADIRELRAALASVEWEAEPHTRDGGECRWCLEAEKQGHADDCAVAAVLARTAHYGEPHADRD